MAESIKVFDCDGHIVESISDMVPFLEPVNREMAFRPSRNRQGVFAGLDAIRYPRNIHRTGEVIEPSRPHAPPSDSSRARICPARLPRRVRPLPRSAYRFLRRRWRLDSAFERPQESRRQHLHDTDG